MWGGQKTRNTFDLLGVILFVNTIVDPCITFMIYIYENSNTNNLYQYGLLNKNSRSVNFSADALKNRQYNASEPLRQASMSTCLPAIYRESRHVKTQQINNLTNTLQTTPSAVTPQRISNNESFKISILSPFCISGSFACEYLTLVWLVVVRRPVVAYNRSQPGWFISHCVRAYHMSPSVCVRERGGLRERFVITNTIIHIRY